jgi:hypothetical protein
MEQHSLFFLFVNQAQVEKAKRNYNTVTMRYQDELVFSATEEKTISRMYQDRAAPFVVRVNGTETPLYFDLDETADETQVVDDLSAWIAENKFPLVSWVSGANIAELGESGRLLCAAVYDPAVQQPAEFYDTFLKFARSAITTNPEYTKFHFAVMDGKEEKADEFLASYDVDVNALPMVVVMDLNQKGDERYFNENITRVEQVEEFLQGIVNGTVTSQVHGFFGLPDRNWRNVKSILPVLSALDFLPAGTFVISIMVLFIGSFCKVLCDEFEDEGWSPPEGTVGHIKSD